MTKPKYNLGETITFQYYQAKIVEVQYIRDDVNEWVYATKTDRYNSEGMFPYEKQTSKARFAGVELEMYTETKLTEILNSNTYKS